MIRLPKNGQTQAVTTVEAQYVSSASAETVNPYVGKLITGLSISGVTAQQQADLLPILTERVGDAVSVDGVFRDVTNLGNTGYFSELTLCSQQYLKALNWTLLLQ